MKNKIFVFFVLALIVSRASFAQEVQEITKENVKIKGIKAERYYIENYDSDEDDGKE